METKLPGYYSLDEAAEALGYRTKSNLSNACKAGKIPAYKVANVWLIPANVVDDLLRRDETGQGGRGQARK